MKNLTVIEHPQGQRKNLALREICAFSRRENKRVLVISGKGHDGLQDNVARIVIIGGRPDVVLIDMNALSLADVEALASEFQHVQFVASLTRGE